MIGCSQRWSATPRRSNPASSAAPAMLASISPKRFGPPSQSKLLSCSPIFMDPSFPAPNGRYGRPSLPFEPLGDHAVAGVDVHVPGPPGPGVDVAVGRTCGHDQDLACFRLERGVAHGEDDLALLNDEDLRVGMGVEPRPAPGWRVHEEERDFRAAVQVPLEPAGGPAARKVVLLDDAGSWVILRRRHD